MNEVLLAYVKAYKDQYPLPDLKEKMLSKGYPEQEIDKAIQAAEQSFQPQLYNPLTHSDSSKKQEENKKQPLPQPRPEPKPFTPTTVSGLERSGKRSRRKGFKLMKTSGILGILILILIIGFVTLRFFNTEPLSTFMLMSVGGALMLFYLIYLLGIIRLGKHTEEKLLRRAAGIKVIILLLLIGVSIAFFMTNEIGTQGLLEQLSLSWIVIFLVLFIAHITIKYVYAAGLKGAGDIIGPAKAAGIINLILAVIYTLYLAGTLYLSFDTALLLRISNMASSELLAMIMLAGTVILTIVALLLESIAMLKASGIFE